MSRRRLWMTPYIFFITFSKNEGRDARSMTLQYENRAPDLYDVEFLTNVRNNRAKKHNEVKFEPTDVLLLPFNKTKSVVKFGLN